MTKKTWLDEFEKNPPTDFPIHLEHQGLQHVTKGGFDNLTEFQSALMFARSSLKEPQRDSINAKKTKQEALTQLWRQLDAAEFFDTWRRLAMTRKIRADRLSVMRLQQKAERDASRAERQAIVWQRITDDAEDLFGEVLGELKDHTTIDLGAVGALAGKLGSLMTRLKYQVAKGMRDVA